MWSAYDEASVCVCVCVCVYIYDTLALQKYWLSFLFFG